METKRKTRDGHARKSKPGKPAKIEQAEVPPPTPAQPPFDAKAKADELRIWAVSGKDRYVEMPAPGEPAHAPALSLGRDDVKMRFRRAGVENRAMQDELLIHIQKERAVDFAGELAGWKVGVQPVSFGRIAITRSFRLVEPCAGEWPVIRAFVDSWFDDADEPQLDYFLAWIQTAIVTLRAGVRSRPGFLLAQVGPSNCGKTFAQRHLITPLLGGRFTDPLPWLLGGETFNDDVARAEALMISEMRGCKVDATSRADLGEAFKTLLVNPDMRIRAPYAGAVNAETFRRVCVALNNEVDRMKVFPPLAAGFADKVLMLLHRAPVLPLTDSADSWTALEKAIARELPAFAHYIENEWQIPARLRVGADIGRFGFRHYIHPTLSAELFEQEPENHLLHLLDGTPEIWTRNPAEKGEGRDSWGWGKAEDLREIVFAGPRAEQAKRAFPHSGGFAQYLGKLATRMPARFQKKHTNAGNVWMLHPSAVG